MKSGKQLNILKRISPKIDKECRLCIYDTFIRCHFNYCNIVWMCCPKTSFCSLEKINERALKFVSNRHEIEYNNLLKVCQRISVKQIIVKHLAIEMFKVFYNMAPLYITNLFHRKENLYNLITMFQNFTVWI